MAFDEAGQADTAERNSGYSVPMIWSDVGFAPEGIIFDPNIFAVATGIEEHNEYGRLYRGHPPDTV